MNSCENCEAPVEGSGRLCRRCRVELELDETETEDAAMVALVDAVRAHGIKVPQDSGVLTRVLLKALYEMPAKTDWQVWAESQGVAAIQDELRKHA